VVPGWELAVHPDDRMAVSEAWASFVRGEREFQEEFRYRHEDGKESYVRAAAVRLDGEGGNPPSFLRVEQDLTELRRSQRLVDEQRLKMVAASKLTALGEMAGGVAHEINNPLAIIHGNAEVLRLWAEQGELDRERVCTMAQTLSITTTRIAKIVRGLRTISRNAEHDPCEQAPLAPLLEHVVSLSAARARDEQIEIEVSPVPPDFTVPCRPAQVSQVLLNLLNNAFYACREGERWVRLEVKDGGSEVEIAVLDGGRGVPPSVREKLFQPFFTTKPVGSGTGLGLSIGAALAESHGGSLALDPASPRTRFVLKLPKHAYRKAS
jgi:C4-dicarboxylate-specific signal transduction histidine kinase